MGGLSVFCSEGLDKFNQGLDNGGPSLFCSEGLDKFNQGLDNGGT